MSPAAPPAERPAAEDLELAIRPQLTQHFKPALLARMTIIPFTPAGPEVMRDITAMKLHVLADRLRASHRIETTFAPELVDTLARRCTESETGARNVEHLLRGSLLPAVARELLQRLVAERVPTHLHVGLTGEGQWRTDFTGTRA